SGRRPDRADRPQREVVPAPMPRALLAAAVAIAFADSSIVVLALPELYGRFHTTITGVSWVITAYNAAVALAALGLVVLVRRVDARALLAVGLASFLAASIACAVANSLGFLIAARTVQGVGAALVLARSRPMARAEEGLDGSFRRTLPANACLGLLFGALVGALFLAVLLVISVWSYWPIGGALIVSALPAAALAASPLEARLPGIVAV